MSKRTITDYLGATVAWEDGNGAFTCEVKGIASYGPEGQRENCFVLRPMTWSGGTWTGHEFAVPVEAVIAMNPR